MAAECGEKAELLEVVLTNASLSLLVSLILDRRAALLDVSADASNGIAPGERERDTGRECDRQKRSHETLGHWNLREVCWKEK